MKKIHLFVRLMILVFFIISFLFVIYFSFKFNGSFRSYLWFITSILFFIFSAYLVSSGRKSKQENFWKNHPEKLKGEIFFSNVDSTHFDSIEYSTKRAGIVAYDCNGKKFGKYPETFPVFVKISELKSSSKGRILLERMENKY